MEGAAGDSRVVLHVLEGPAAGQRHAVDGELRIGRASAGIGALGGDQHLSRSHAVLARQPDGTVSISDLESRHGTWVNGLRIRGTRALGPGDRVSVGKSTIEIEVVARALEQPRSEAPHQAGTGLVVIGSQRRAIPPAGLSIGRDHDNDVVLDVPHVSRHHASIELSEHGYFVRDLGSSNGIEINGTKLRDAAQWLRDGDVLTLGTEQLRFALDGRTQLAPSGPPGGSRQLTVSLTGPRTRIGRDPQNDLVLADPNVSRFHAELARRDGQLELRDLGSRNGTYVDGVPVTRSIVRRDAVISIGNHTLRLDTGTLEAAQALFDLAARNVTVRAGDVTILAPTSLTVAPGSFVAIIGASGSGKTTLLKALAGVSKPDAGTVTINGDPLDIHRAEIGYLPQDEIVHPALTVREALRYAAKLRLPDDTSNEEVDRVIEQVLDELDLRHRADVRIANLSGGQRKRAGLGTELVSRPRLLFLDEATTGLDPVLERRMMELMRSLAGDGRSVVTVTHATRNLDLCDAVVVMGEGGRLCFMGPPSEARAFFEVDQIDEIYHALERRPASEWQQRYQRPPTGPAAAEPERPGWTGRRSRRVRRKPWRQTRILAARYLKTSIRDRRNLILLLGQVPILAAIIATLYPTDIWSSPANAHSVAGLIFLMVTLAIWVGAIDASREVIKERRVIEREAAIGVGRLPYLCSKLCVLFSLAAIQAATLVIVIAAIRPGGPRRAELLIIILATAWTAASMGLLISALVKTENQAVSLIPLALIPQLLFAGQIVPYATMPSILRAISYVIFARWAFAGTGRIVDMAGRLSVHELAVSYGHRFFATPLDAIGAILVAFALGFLVLTITRLPRSGAR